MTAVVYPDWKAKIIYSADGPKPQILATDDRIKIVLVGLETGQRIPSHPAKMAAYHILEGSGWVIVDDERIPVSAGATVIAPDQSSRGVEAATRMAFIAARAV